MSRRTLILMAAACLLCAGISPAAFGQGDSYSGVVNAVNGTGGNQVQIKFTISKWATQDEIKQLGAVLKDKGQSALLEELKKLDSGRIGKVVGDTGNQIAVAEKWQNGDKTVITMISARRISLGETRNRGVSMKYPFAFLQVTLDANGEGSGKLVSAAAIKYDEKTGTPKLDPYGNGAAPVNNVKPLK